MRITDDVILLSSLFNGEYIKNKIGGEIINLFQSDNGNYYIYINPYGNIGTSWDGKIKYVLFIRSVGNGVVKVIAKSEIEEHVNPKSAFSKNETESIDLSQKEYIEKNNITYGGVCLDELGSWSKYYVTFKAKATYLSKINIYLSTKKGDKSSGTLQLENIGKINNTSQKCYIEKYGKYKKIINYCMI